MDFLNKEIEDLLQECLNRFNDFPAVLAEKFEGLTFVEEELLKSRIDFLCDNGYFSNIQWADNVPCLGRIEQKAYEYFRLKEIYIRAKLREDSYFTSLDEEAEKELFELLQSSEKHLLITGYGERERILKYLRDEGFVEFGSKGLSHDLGGNFHVLVFVTQKGKNYFIDKENRIEEILTLGEDAFVVNNINTQYNVSRNTISNSPFQVGDSNIQNIDYSDYEKKLSELKNEISLLKLSNEQAQTFSGLISKAENECKRKNGGALEKVLKEILIFSKQFGFNMMASYIISKFGLNI